MIVRATYHLVLLECEPALLVERWAAGACVSVVVKQAGETAVEWKLRRKQGGADDDVRMLSFEQLRMVLYAPRLSLMPINACH